MATDRIPEICAVLKCQHCETANLDCDRAYQEGNRCSHCISGLHDCTRGYNMNLIRSFRSGHASSIINDYLYRHFYDTFNEQYLQHAPLTFVAIGFAALHNAIETGSQHDHDLACQMHSRIKALLPNWIPRARNCIAQYLFHLIYAPFELAFAFNAQTANQEPGTAVTKLSRLFHQLRIFWLNMPSLIPNLLQHPHIRFFVGTNHKRPTEAQLLQMAPYRAMQSLITAYPSTEWGVQTPRVKSECLELTRLIFELHVGLRNTGRANNIDRCIFSWMATMSFTDVFWVALGIDTEAPHEVWKAMLCCWGSVVRAAGARPGAWYFGGVGERVWSEVDEGTRKDGQRSEGWIILMKGLHGWAGGEAVQGGGHGVAQDGAAQSGGPSDHVC